MKRLLKPHRKILKGQSRDNILGYAPFIAIIIAVMLQIYSSYFNQKSPIKNTNNVYIKTYTSLDDNNMNGIHHTLHRIPVVDNIGLCLDGSNPVFYYKPSRSIENSTKYIIHFEEGATCYNNDHCFKQSKTKYGSTAKYDKQYAYIHYTEHNSFWNSIYIRSCDGYLFLGNNEYKIQLKLLKRIRKKLHKDHFKRSDNNITDIYYQGSIIVNNLLKYMFGVDSMFNMNNSTDIVLSGIGKSCISVLSNFDRIYNYIKLFDTNNRINIDVMLMNEKDHIVKKRKKHLNWIINTLNIVSSLNSKCIKHYLGEYINYQDECLYLDGNRDLLSNVTRCLNLDVLRQFISLKM